MKIVRKIEIDTNTIKIGDQIQVPLIGLGVFTATAHKIADKYTLFIFDCCICKKPMNYIDTNKGGYEASDLKKWIDNELINLFPEDLRNRITDLSIPTYGMLFGHEYNEWDNEHFEADNDIRLEMMRKRKKRISCFGNDYLEFYWLRNAMKKEYSDNDFACVDYVGNSGNANASCIDVGVRPMFILKKEAI